MSAQTATLNILTQILSEFGDRLSIHGASNILVSDASIAQALYTATESVRTPFGPQITVASPIEPDAAAVQDIPNTSVRAAENLDMDHYTHAVFGVASEDPKYLYGGLKHTVYALQPKGYAIVISIKQETKEAGAGKFQVALEDKLKYQSEGKIENLRDVLYYAGFERGKIRSFDRSAMVEGQEVQAEVLLAMKWDQLNA
ncbi:uncharacterized protein MYCFIDRAFT_196246 [Pseudocercospora fijiensis CIRAD86]|uniref:Uncharacterized protein n=1 Tax=Pseudocercospora fijiensis (strain CIRAD86) TaxID=383855 RepID=M2ZUW1_PSEFD|nr:uncharacterized protein MYCFIDRAFT_196246 [Pseudocercospora fijiensis CIRAD86]EME82779.1 hypothetical protein MYCFIDRAFT_196246 [Pseudocercospora fijiensis CIRAD86]